MALLVAKRAEKSRRVERWFYSEQALHDRETRHDAGFDERTTSGAVASLIEAAAAVLPAARDAAFVDVRAGLRPALENGDGCPFLGPSPSLAGVTVAGGHFRNGVLLAPLTAATVADQVLGDGNAKTQ